MCRSVENVFQQVHVDVQMRCFAVNDRKNRGAVSRRRFAGHFVVVVELK